MIIKLLISATALFSFLVFSVNALLSYLFDGNEPSYYDKIFGLSYHKRSKLKLAAYILCAVLSLIAAVGVFFL